MGVCVNILDPEFQKLAGDIGADTTPKLLIAAANIKLMREERLAVAESDREKESAMEYTPTLKEYNDYIERRKAADKGKVAEAGNDSAGMVDRRSADGTGAVAQPANTENTVRVQYRNSEYTVDTSDGKNYRIFNKKGKEVYKDGKKKDRMVISALALAGRGDAIRFEYGEGGKRRPYVVIVRNGHILDMSTGKVVDKPNRYLDTYVKDLLASHKAAKEGDKGAKKRIDALIDKYRKEQASVKVKGSKSGFFAGWGFNLSNGIDISDYDHGLLIDTDNWFEEGTEINGIDVGDLSIRKAHEKIRGDRTMSEKETNELYRTLYRVWGGQNMEWLDEERKKIKGVLLTARNREDLPAVIGVFSMFKDTDPENVKKEEERMRRRELLNANDATEIQNAIPKIDLEFDPFEKMERARRIATFFGYVVDDYLDEHPGMTRKQAIQEMTPKAIFDRVREDLEAHVSEGLDGQIVTVRNNLIWGGYSAADAEKVAPVFAERRMAAFRKMLANFDDLCMAAAPFLHEREGLHMSVNSEYATDVDNRTGDENGENTNDEGDTNDRNGTKDGWMQEWGMSPLKDSISQKLRRLFARIKMRDSEGRVILDDLGEPKVYDGSYIYAQTNDILSDMDTVDDVMPLLEKAVHTKPWVRTFLEIAKNQPELITELYTAMRNEFNEYRVYQMRKLPDGSYKFYQTRINRPDGMWFLMNEWEDNYNSRLKLDENTIYDEAGEMVKENVDYALRMIEKIGKEIGDERVREFNYGQRKKDYEERKKNGELYPNEVPEGPYDFTYVNRMLAKDGHMFKAVMKLLRMAGFTVDEDSLHALLKNVTSEQLAADNMYDMIHLLDLFYDKLRSDKYLLRSTDGRVSMFMEYAGYIYKIAKMVRTVTEDGYEANSIQDGKSYYNYTKPNYIRKTVRRLNMKSAGISRIDGYRDRFNSYMDKFNDYIDREFKKYDFFYDKKNGRWRSGILREITEYDYQLEMMSVISQKFGNGKAKTSDKYSDFEHYVMMWNAFHESFRNDKAWYKIPNYADIMRDEFILMPVYEKELKGTYAEGYKPDDLYSLFEDLVIQEVNRIRLVRERKGKAVELIPNYDMDASKDGIGGAKFCFMPYLNEYEYGGKPFIDSVCECLEVLDDDEGNLSAIGNLKSVMRAGLDAYFHHVVMEEVEKMYRAGMFKANGIIRTEHGIEQTNEKIGFLKSILKNRNLEDYMSKDLRNGVGECIVQLERYGFTDPVKYQYVFDFLTDAVEEAHEDHWLTDDERKSLLKEISDIDRNNKSSYEMYEYFTLNVNYATSQIYQLFLGDIGFCGGDPVELQKRWKGAYSMTEKAATKKVLENGEVIEKTKDVRITIKDEVSVSKQAEVFKAVLDRAGLDSSWVNERINQTDGQSFRTLKSYRDFMQLINKFSEEQERAYQNIIHGRAKPEDAVVVMKAIKPLLYTQMTKPDGRGGEIKVPVFIKNSEAVLLSVLSGLKGTTARNEKKEALSEFMEENGIDVADFSSTVKLGMSGVIDLTDAAIEKERRLLASQGKPSRVKDAVTSLLEKRCFTTRTDGTTTVKEVNREVVQEYPFEDTGIITETTDHGMDSMQLVPTQLRKLVQADMSNDFMVMFDNILEPMLNLPDDTFIPDAGKTVGEIRRDGLGRDQWQKMFNAVITENLLENFRTLENKIDTPEKLSRMLLDEMNKSDRYTTDMKRAVSLDEYGNFNIPLFDQSQAGLIQPLLNSIVKHAITKQKARGGAFVQMTNWGYDDSVNLIFKDEYGNEMSYEWYQANIEEEDVVDVEESRAAWRRYVAEHAVSPAYYECYIQVPSMELYNAMMRPGGWIDMSLLPDELKYIVGTRVPCEDSYSTFPMKIKGFLPPTNGAMIVLPKEITLIAGLDFDIDKLYVTLPEFTIERYDMERAHSDYAVYRNGTVNWNVKMGGNVRIMPFKEWLSHNRSKYRLENPKIGKVQYDFTKAAKDNTTKQRNNLMLDLMFASMTGPDAMAKMLNPGGFEQQKRAAKFITVLENAVSLGFSSAREVMKKSRKEIAELYDRVNGGLDPLSAGTQVHFHREHKNAGFAVGVYANGNSVHSFLQHTEAEVNPAYKVELFGRTETDLHAIKDRNGKYITRNVASWIPAATYNAEFPTLGALKQDENSINVTCYLAALGYTPREIGVLLSQPIIREVYGECENNSGYNIFYVIENIISKYENANILFLFTSNNIVKKYNMDEIMSEYSMCDNIIQAQIIRKNNIKNLTDIRAREEYIAGFYFRQVVIAQNFKKILQAAESYKRITLALRADSQTGALQGSFASTIKKLMQLDTLIMDMNATLEGKPLFPIIGIKNIINIASIRNKTMDELRKMFNDAPIQFFQAFLSLGLTSSDRLFGNYFPHFGRHFTDMLNAVKAATARKDLSEKEIKSIIEDYFTYIMSQSRFFGTDENMTAEEKRDIFINHFADYFFNTVIENEGINSLPFIKKMKSVSDKKQPVKTVEFKQFGRLPNDRITLYTNNWAQLLYKPDREANNLAYNLQKYDYFRHGFSFVPKGYIQFQPFILKKSNPEYISLMNSILNTEYDYANFVKMYVRNHLYGNMFTKQVVDSTKKGVDPVTADFFEKGRPKDDVIIIADGRMEKYFSLFRGKEIADYIRFNRGGITYFYEVAKAMPETGMYEYRRIYPLGYGSSFKEYEYGKDPDKVNSVIYRNTKEYADSVLKEKGEKMKKSLWRNPDYSNAPETEKGPDEGYDVYGGFNYEAYMTQAHPQQVQDGGMTDADYRETLSDDNTPVKDANGKISC